MTTAVKTTVLVERAGKLYGRDVQEKWFLTYTAGEVTASVDVRQRAGSQQMMRETDVEREDIPATVLDAANYALEEAVSL